MLTANGKLLHKERAVQHLLTTVHNMIYGGLFMKIFIWVVCVFVFESILIMLNKLGVYLGGIPTFIFYGCMFYTASALSRKLGDKWEMNRMYKKSNEAGMTLIEYVKKDIPKSFLIEIENRSQTLDGLNGYLNMCVKEKIITRLQADIIISDANSAKKK